jgi:hypothetical protein
MTLPSTDININTPKKKAIALGILVLVFIVGFAFGKFNNKPNVTIDQTKQTTSQVQDTTKTQVADQQTVVAQQQTNLNVNQVQDTDTTVTTTTDKKPDGEEVTTTTTETKQHVDDTDKTQQTTKDTTNDKEAEQQAVVDNTKTTEKDTFHETITQSQPNWRLAVFGGINTAGLGLSGNSLVTGPLSYGGEVDRRILGPVWLGVMGEKAGPGFEVNGVLSIQF